MVLVLVGDGAGGCWCWWVLVLVGVGGVDGSVWRVVVLMARNGKVDLVTPSMTLKRWLHSTPTNLQ